MKNVEGFNMGYRIIFISNPCRLSVKNEQLLIDNGDMAQISLEDIECIVADSMQITFNSFLLVKLAEYKITFFVTDRSHIPSGAFLPFQQHSRRLAVLRAQINMTEPTKKRLWKKIVAQKIENQAMALRFIGIQEWKEIDILKHKVKSGDVSNMEAVAAAKYFKMLFGAKFTRSEECAVNAMLNYGYAILRSTIAKNVVAYGFESSLGLNHCSTLNGFNLVDDLIEPFRPLVDMFVKSRAENVSELTTSLKAELVDLLNHDVLISGKRFACARATEEEVMSLTSFLNGNVDELNLPSLIGLERHRYE